jgi:hypothetical protein
MGACGDSGPESEGKRMLAELTSRLEQKKRLQDTSDDPSAGGRGRGRPKGSFGGFAARSVARSRRLSQLSQRLELATVAGPESIVAGAAEETRLAVSHLAVQLPQVGHSLSSLLDVGTFGKVLKRPSTTQAGSCDDHIQVLMNMVGRMQTLSQAGVALFCGVRLPSVGKVEADIAAALYQISRTSWSSLCAYLFPLLQNSALTGVMMTRNFQYDETPVTLRMGSTQSSQVEETSVAKVAQIELELGLLLTGPLLNGRRVFLCGEVSVPLQSVDRSTSECLVFALDRAADLACWDDLHQYFHTCVDISTCDRASANLKAEREYVSRRPWCPRLTIPCEIHILSTVQCKALNTNFSQDVTGMVAAALAMQLAGSSKRFREIMTDLIARRIDIFRGAGPEPPSSPAGIRRRAFLDFIFGDEICYAERKLVLSTYCGDIDSKEIRVYGACDRQEVARAISQALLPRALPVFPRHRWLSSAECILELALLHNIHGIWEDSVEIWVAEKKSTNKQHDGHEDDIAEHGPDLATKPSSSDWAEKNERHRGSMLDWVRSKPAANLIIMLTFTRPQVKNLALYFQEAGAKWDEQQLFEALEHEGSRQYRLCK